MAEGFELAQCPACDSPRARRFMVGSTALRRCRDCALVYAEKVGDPTEIYSDHYLTGESEYGPDTTDPIVVAVSVAMADRRFEMIETALGIGNVLDVGCGSGEQLDVARRRGWSGIGVEPVEASAVRARERGLDVRTCTLTDSPLPYASFDAVLASHVLEHVLSPVAFLRELALYAKPGGLVAVEVPNWRNWQRWVKGPDWEQLCPLEHVSHFTPRTLGRTMRRAGLHPRVQTDTILSPNRFVESLGFGWAVVATAIV